MPTAPRAPDEDAERARLRERLERWRSAGHVVTSLEEILSTDVNAARERVEEFERDLFALEGLREALADLEAAGLGPELDEVRGKFSDPRRLSEIEDDILRLQLKVERRRKSEARKDEEEGRERERFLARIRSWTEDGFATGPLLAIAAGPLDTLAQRVEQFEDGLTELRRLAGELEALAPGPEELHRLRPVLTDPTRITEAEEEVLKLRLRLDRTRRRDSQKEAAETRIRERYRLLVGDWRSQGYKVERLESLLTGHAPLPEIEAAVDRTRRAIARLMVLREELDALAADGFASEVEALQERMSDVDALEKVDEHVLKLHLEAEKRRREAERRKARDDRVRQEIRGRLRQLEEEGFHTAPAEQALQEGQPLPRVGEIVDRLEEGARHLRPLRDELQTLAADLASSEESDLFADELARLRALAADPLMSKGIEEGIIDLEVRRERGRRERMRRSDIGEALAAWAREGYAVQSLQAGVDGLDLRVLEREFVTLKIGIHTLKDFERELLMIPAAEFPDEWESVKRLLADAEHIPEVERRLLELQRRVEERLEEARSHKAEEARIKRTMMEKIATWVAEGFRSGLMERVETIVATGGRGALDEARRDFLTLESLVERVRELRGVLDTMGTQGYEAEAEQVRRRLADLANEEALGAVEHDLLDLLQRIQGRAEQLERIHAEEDDRRTAFKDQIATWTAEGFRTTELQSLADASPLAEFQTMTRALVVTRIRIQRLRQLQGELAALRANAPAQLAERGQEVRAVLGDPDRLAEAEEAVTEYRLGVDRATEEDRRRGEIRAWVEGRKAGGFNMGRLEAALDRDPGLLAKEYLVMKIKVQKLDDLRDDLRATMSTAEDPREYLAQGSAIEGLLRDPERITEIRERISAVRDAIERRREEGAQRRDEERRFREEFAKRLTQWVSEGYPVEDLEKVFEGPVDDLQRRFREFEAAVRRSKEMEAELGTLSGQGFEGEVELLHRRLRTLQDLDGASRDVAALQERVVRVTADGSGVALAAGVETRAAAVRERIGRWKAEGLVVGHLEELLVQDPARAEEAVLDFVVRLEEARAVDSQLALLDTQGAVDEAEAIREMLRDVRRVPEAKAQLQALEGRLTARRREDRRKRLEERELRQVYTTRLIEYISQGYDVSRLERFIGGPLDVVAREFQLFEKDVSSLQWTRGAVEVLRGHVGERDYRELEALSTMVDRAGEAEQKARGLLLAADLDPASVRPSFGPLPPPDQRVPLPHPTGEGDRTEVALLEAFGVPPGAPAVAGPGVPAQVSAAAPAEEGPPAPPVPTTGGEDPGPVSPPGEAAPSQPPEGDALRPAAPGGKPDAAEGMAPQGPGEAATPARKRVVKKARHRE